MTRHQASVRGYLVFLGCPSGWLDDLTQDVFLSVLSSRFEERHPHATAAFLRRVARNLFLKALRREGRSTTLSDDFAELESAWSEFEGEDAGQSYLAALRECLQTVRGRAREVLELRYSACLRRNAIAARLELSEGGVKSILVRTRKALRGCIERRLAL